MSPKQSGTQIQCSIYLDPAIFKKIEAKRGDVKRSTFLSKLIEGNMTA